MELESYVWSNSKNLKLDIEILIPKMRKTLVFMDETINQFGEFYKSDSSKVYFILHHQIEEIKELLSAKSIAFILPLNVKTDF